MTQIDEIYKCEICGNVVCVVESGVGVLVCCGQDMKLMESQTEEKEGKEKHVPVVKIEDNKVKVNVGSIDHPMEEGHFIELIQIIRYGSIIATKRLKPGDKPYAEFCLNVSENLKARIFCNIHGLWIN